MESSLPKYTISFGVSLAISSVLNALLMVAKEKSHAVQGWMQKMTGHHWVTHCLIVLALFLFFGLLFAKANRGEGLKMAADNLIKIIVAGVVAGYLIIAGFYLVAG